ncbi:TonB-dependent receptor [Xanthomarina sp. F1114]|uniref:SusC/RagA family TonB-linked outer membrane protein n=1 Tax=Xanthomarina sp. F1114 TaxID=2996019 RepID=UPI00225E36B0|nr:TonB-dependent receptor [Xanthomarina sp. F1114]MCX7547202.1 TonB-dependent receptor [Xanthomarina sp. F1114]
MRLFVFLCCLSAFSFTPNTIVSQNAKVTIDMDKTVSVDEVFDIIMTQTDYRFIYQEGLFNNLPKVNLRKGSIRANNLLKRSLSSGNFDFEFIQNNTIVIKNVPLSEMMIPQEREVTGMIKDETGMPMAGVTIVIEGTQKGVVTNFDGGYSIFLDGSEDVLVFSSLGYKTERITVGEQKVINLTMKEDLSQLEEIVLIGYGEQKREDVTGAVSSVKTEEIVQAATGAIGFDKALGGLVKGVQVSQSSGRPGAPARLNIRGVTSPLSNVGGLNQPLYVIDGVPFNIDALGGANPLLTINPTDIESFDILKDAAATSIYGSRGANGVILIQTKRGKRNQDPTINVSFTSSFAKPINTLDVLNGKQYSEFYDLLLQNSVNAMNAGQMDPFMAFDLANIGYVDIDFSTFEVTYDGLREDYFGTANTDWNDVVFRDLALTSQANVSYNGGSERTNYSLSLSLIDQEGLTVYDEMSQYTLGISLDTDVSKYIKVGGSANLGYTKSQSGEDDLFGQYTVNTAIAQARPDLPVYDENGQLLGQEVYTYGFPTYEPNPLMRLQNKTTNQAYNFIGNAYIEVEPIKKLKVKADVNSAVFYSDYSSFIPKITQTDFVFFENDSFLSEETALVSNLTTNLTASYDFTLSNNHFNVMLGAAWDRTNFDNKNQFYSGFPNDDVLINATAAETVIGYGHTKLETGLNSLFSRVTYDYKGRYNATFNFRTDTSSKFGPDNKRAYFPSLSAGWNITNENFMADSKTFDALKFRASAGRVGSTNVSDYAYIQFIGTTVADNYLGNTGLVLGNNFPNPNVGWETTEELNLGLDFGLFNSRLRGGIDVYTRKTNGALVKAPIPLELGPSTYYSNLIDVTNKGVEVSLGGDIIKNNNFTWSANINWALNRNKLVSLNGANINNYQLDYFIEGQPVGTIKGYKVVKIFQSQDEVDALNADSPTGLYDQFSTGAGDYMYEDINGDGLITQEDRTIIGDIEPDFFGGISNTFQYKNLTLTALFQYSVGAESVWNSIPQGTFNNLGENKYSEYALNTWTPENPNAQYARALYFDPSASSRVSDRYLHDASYLRLKSLQLSYKLDSNLMNKMGVDFATIMLTGSNLVTWTKWPGVDPETFSERGGIIDSVSNEDPYPLARSFSLGLQVQF